MITNLVIFAFFTGLLTVPVILGARSLFAALRLQLTWWKWLLAAVWYFLLLFFVFLDFTMIGEGEAGAGLKMLAAESVIMMVLGVGLVRILMSVREKTS